MTARPVGRRPARRVLRRCVPALVLVLGAGCTDGALRQPRTAAAEVVAPPGAEDPAPEPAPRRPPADELLEVTGPGCLGVGAGPPVLAGGPAEPVATFDATRDYVTFFSTGEPRDVLVARIEGSTCGPAVRVNPKPGSGRSHDAPSVFVDGLGYVYVSYFGSFYGQSGPALRRTRRPHDLAEWEPEGRTRLFSGGELNGFRLDDGAVVLVGSNFSTRVDVIEPGGRYRWPAARQVVAQDSSPRGSACGSPGNRFTKGVVEAGWRTEAGGRVLVAAWGWGGGFSDNARPDWLCPDIRAYQTDSHEVFFAFSDDGGVTWQDKDRTKRVTAPPCPTPVACGRPVGIRHDDPAFRVTRTRQRGHRAIWADDDGTVYIAFERSEWCDSGDDCQTRSATRPGALALLRFRLGGPVEEGLVDPAPHSYTTGVRKAGGSLYVWSKNDRDQMVYEYRSDDEGATWSRKIILRGYRMHGTTRIPGLDAMRLVISANGGAQRVHLYRRSFPAEDREPPSDGVTG